MLINWKAQERKLNTFKYVTGSIFEMVLLGVFESCHQRGASKTVVENGVSHAEKWVCAVVSWTKTCGYGAKEIS